MRIAILLVLLVALPFVWAQTEEEATKALEKAREDVEEMSALGLGTRFVEDAIKSASKALEEGDYSTTMAKAREISARKERALMISDSLRALDLRMKDIQKKGLDVSSAMETRAAALGAFARENYDEAEEFVFLSNKHLNEAEAEYSLVQARYSAARDNAIAYVQEHRVGIALITLFIVIMGIILYHLVLLSTTRNRLRDLELEKEVLADLMKKTQEGYYTKNAIPKSTYDIRMKKYQERSMEVEELIPVLRTRLERLKRYSLRP